MKKYEVRTEMVQTKDGRNPIRVYNEQVDREPTVLASFDTLEEAKAFYETVKCCVRYCGNRLFEHECKWIEENEYDKDGEWISGGDWWVFDFPEYIEEKED